VHFSSGTIPALIQDTAVKRDPLNITLETYNEIKSKHHAVTVKTIRTEYMHGRLKILIRKT
jgi:hypothetical protein